MLQGGAQAPKNDDCAHGRVLPKNSEKNRRRRHRDTEKSRNRTVENQNLPQLNVDDRGLNQDQNLFTTMNEWITPSKTRSSLSETGRADVIDPVASFGYFDHPASEDHLQEQVADTAVPGVCKFRTGLKVIRAPRKFPSLFQLLWCKL
jgi:hypothetical protein